jgi:hypothetical protein
MSMNTRTGRLLAVGVLVAAGLAVAGQQAGAAPGPGTFTKITTPSQTVHYKWNPADPAGNKLTVSGTTSNDVSLVDIDCIFNTNTGPSVITFADSVEVNEQAFSTQVPVNFNNSPPPPCRLRAVPHEQDATSYVSSYAGPLLYTYAFAKLSDGASTLGFQAIAGQGSGYVALASADTCGILLAVTFDLPLPERHGPGSPQCGFGLTWQNQGVSGAPDASTIRVDGKNAYLPIGVDVFLRTNLALPVAQSVATVHYVHRANGDFTITDSAPLMRCAGDNTYPPTVESCSSLVNSGVRFERSYDVFTSAHRIRVRDAFVATNGHAHSVTAQYQVEVPAAGAGTPGFDLPADGKGFVTFTADKVTTGLGTKANTLLSTSDFYAVTGDQAVNSTAFSWSRAPKKIQFAHSGRSDLALPYAFNVPAHGAFRLGFAESEGPLTSTVKKLAVKDVADMMNAPSISAPKKGAVIHGHSTTVKGSVTLGANGLPTSVRVNGHAARITTVSAAKANYAVTFRQPFGTHKLTAVAKDAAGNTRSKSINVKNVR